MSGSTRFGDLFGVLLFLTLNAAIGNVIVPQSQLDSLVEIDRAGRSRSVCCPKRACWARDRDDRRQHWSNRHDLFPGVEVGPC